MAQDWFYKLLGEETGPVTFDALRDLARDGHLGEEDEVRTSMSRWTLARDFPELFYEGDVLEPEFITDLDLDQLLVSSSDAPAPRSEKRKALDAARAAALVQPPQWFYSLLGQQMGPVSEKELMQLVRDGSLSGADTARLGEEGEWRPLGQTPPFAAIVASLAPKPEWYCRILGQELGPMMFTELQEMAASGSLNADDEARFGTTEPWMRADRTRGLNFHRKKTAPAKAHDASSTLVPFGDAARKKEWYYMIMGQELGPISFNELKKSADDGSLTYDDRARKGKSGHWMLVMDVPGLVTIEAKAAYLAEKVEASKPKPAPPPPKPVALLPVTPLPVATAAPIAPTPVTAAAMAPSSYEESPPPPRPTYTPPPMAARPVHPAFAKPVKKSNSGGGGGSLGDQVKDLVGKLGNKGLAVVGVVLLVGLFFALPMLGISFGPLPGTAEYTQLKPLWEKVQAIKKKGNKPADWAAFKADHEDDIKEMANRLKKLKIDGSMPVLKGMLMCSRDHLPKMMAAKDEKELESKFKAMEREMKKAASTIEGKK